MEAKPRTDITGTVDYGGGEFTYLPVISNPAKILCMGLDYEEHRAETGRKETEPPAIFTRYADTLIGHEASILLPSNSNLSTMKENWR